MKIGVITDCFQTDLSDAIRKTAELKLDGVQIYATTGTFSPDTLTDADIASYRKMLKDNDLEISALCGDMGGYGFEIAKDNPERIEKTKRIIDLAETFGVPVVTTHIGVIPADKTDPRYPVMLDALTECGRYAKSKGITLAIETGPEKADVLLAFLQDTRGGVGVNLDPANFVMITAQDPVQAVYLLKDYIVHTHVKDGKMFRETDPRILYDVFAKGGIEALNVSDYFAETPVGTGDVDFPAYLAALKDIGFDGYLTIECETDEHPQEDIRTAADYIRKLL